MTIYEQGKRIQGLARKDLETDGYAVLEAAGSRGIADLVALKPGEALVIQVKKSNPQLSPADRKALLELARITGSTPLVAYKPARKPIVYRELTGPGPQDWRPWFPDRVGVT